MGQQDRAKRLAELDCAAEVGTRRAQAARSEALVTEPSRQRRTARELVLVVLELGCVYEHPHKLEISGCPLVLGRHHHQ